MARLRYNNASGTLGGALTNAGTTIPFGVAPSFATIVSPDTIALTLEPGTANEEIVSLTAYTAGATTGAIARGQEGSTGVSHANASAWVHGPTAVEWDTLLDKSGAMVNVKHPAFGARGDGVTDDSAAFVAAWTYILGRKVVDAENGGYRLLDQLFVPAGKYLITTTEALFTTFGVSTDYINGYTIRGAGRDATRIVFTPASRASLLHNTDQLRLLHMEDMSFYGGNSNAIFLDSVANSGPGNSSQNFTFSRVLWAGTWYEGFQLEGGATANNNAEWTFDHCIAHGNYSRTTADGAITAAGPNLTSATAAFTTSDVGRTVAVTGAGAAGAVLYATVSTYVSATAVTLDTNAGTTVSGAALTINGAFFHCGTTVGQTAQDQFLNYDFISCELELASGDALRFDYGGQVRVYGGSHIVNGNNRWAYLNTGTHSSGVTSFKGDGLRFELHGVSKMLVSNWKHGQIEFNNCTTDGFAIASNQIAATVYGSADQGPNITYYNCTLTGTHEYQYDGNTWNAVMSRVTYKNCYFPQQTDLQSFVVNTALAGNAAAGGTSQVDFESCLGNSTYNSVGAGRAFDVSANWLIRQNGEARRMSRSLKNVAGFLPTIGGWGTPIDVWLPLNCRITDVHFYMPATGTYNGTTWSYTLVDANSVTIATCAPGTAWNLGFSVHVRDLWIVANTDAKRHLQLNALVVTESNTVSECIIDYLPGS